MEMQRSWGLGCNCQKKGCLVSWKEFGRIIHYSHMPSPVPNVWREDTRQRKKTRRSSGSWQPMETAPFLRNRYWILRHGKSIPNEKGLIVSSMQNGTLPEYQLASEGVVQAQLAGELFQKELKENNIPLENVRICYSPFSRTTHTARVVASVLNIPFEGPQCKMMTDLRERYFGPSFELKSHEKYTEIWALDEKDPFRRPEGGECVDDVASRLAIAMANIESEFQGCAVLVASHGDPLQIFQTIVNAVKQQASGSSANRIESRVEEVRTITVLSQHRKFALNTGELRALA